MAIAESATVMAFRGSASVPLCLRETPSAAGECTAANEADIEIPRPASPYHVHAAPIRAALVVSAFFTCPATCLGQEIAIPRTVAERSEYRATARYAEVIGFCHALDEGSDSVRVVDFGRTHEGRALPLIILSKQPLPDEKPWERAELPVILCIGNIHAGEVCGKEALLMIARDLAVEQQPALLEHFILLIAPIYNADGNEQISTGNRPGQIGPEEGMGERANRMGLDLNRDFVKLEAPESRALVRLLNRWDPVVVIDTHTTNGSHHRYTLTYGGPRHASTHSGLAEFVRRELLPSVSRSVAESAGYDTFFYGNFDEDHRRWTTYPALPRYGAHYVGLRNRIAILSEAYAFASYRDRVLATRSFVAECLNAAVERRDRIAELIAAADRQAREGTGEVALRHRLAPYEQKVMIKGFEEHPRDGRQVATKEPRDYEVEYWARSEAEASVVLPAAYLLSPRFTACVQNLQRHGLAVEQLREDIELEVEVSRIAKVTHASRPFEGHRLVSLRVKREPRRRSFSPGTIVIRTTQPLARLAAVLLEPESEDGLAAWNYFDGHVEDGGEFPVYRVPPGQTMPTAPSKAAR